MTEKPEFTLSVPEGKNCVRAVFHAPMTREMTSRYLPEIERLGETIAAPAFLFDARGAPDMRGTLADHEIHEFAKWFGFQGARIAGIVDPGDRRCEFTDTVANDAGYRHRLFTDETEALRWLEKS